MSPMAYAETTRSLVDRPDDVTGYQIHLFYVLPADIADEFRDTFGTLDAMVNEAQQWLKGNLGKQFIIDTYQGKADVTFLKSSYKLKDLCYETECDAISKLITEARIQDPTLSAKKSYFFSISGVLDARYCGWAKASSNLALGFSSGTTCNSPTALAETGLTYPAATFIHEIFHTYGVKHICVNNSDLMLGTPECTLDMNTFGHVRTTLDTSKTNYLGSELAGVDLLKMPIWSDGSGENLYSQYLSDSGNKYLAKLQDGRTFLILGAESNRFDWSWSKNVSRTFQNIECRVTSDSITVVGYAKENACYFDVPNTFQAGSIFEVRQDVYVGPFHGIARETGVVVRADYSDTPCTRNTCIAGASFEYVSCWQKAPASAEIQRIVNGKWVKFESAAISLSDSRCSSTSPHATVIKLNFTEPGNVYLRLFTPSTKSLNGYTGQPFAMIIRNPNTAEPNKDDIIAAGVEAISLGRAADLAAAPKVKTIACIQKSGKKLIKKVTALAPKCPVGYQQKN